MTTSTGQHGPGRRVDGAHARHSFDDRRPRQRVGGEARGRRAPGRSRRARALGDVVVGGRGRPRPGARRAGGRRRLLRPPRSRPAGHGRKRHHRPRARRAARGHRRGADPVGRRRADHGRGERAQGCLARRRRSTCASRRPEPRWPRRSPTAGVPSRSSSRSPSWTARDRDRCCRTCGSWRGRS